MDDDSSELDRSDRNDHINRNHMEMCRFYGEDDPEYEIVSAEIKRHIKRIQDKIAEEEASAYTR